jgi:hypothetical protein
MTTRRTLPTKRRGVAVDGLQSVVGARGVIARGSARAAAECERVPAWMLLPWEDSWPAAWRDQAAAVRVQCCHSRHDLRREIQWLK